MLVASVALAATLLATPDRPEAISLFGEPLRPAAIAPGTRDSLEARLARARAELERSPNDANALIWVGRRTAYLGRFREAIDLYSRGIRRHPRDARFYRHRGHRYLTVRKFDAAIRDLEKAARLTARQPDEIEPDGIPNARNQPTSTLQSNIWYHLGLARYLSGDFARALEAYERCLEVSRNPDMLCATTYWLHRTLTRLGRADDARRSLDSIHAGMDLIENHDYHRLLLVERGEALPDTLLASARRSGGVPHATIGYGLGSHWLAQGERDSAEALLRETVKAGTWAAFGAIAAEAELKRMGARP